MQKIPEKFIVGFDEAGRGPLAGPVYASAVILPENFPVEILNDSKKISEKKRKNAEIINKVNSRSNKGVTDRNSDKTLGVKKESYDPTYEYLCRIGAID